MMNLYLNGILEQEGFFFIKSLLGSPGKPGFIECIAYLSFEDGKFVLKRPGFSDLELDLEPKPDNPKCPWRL